MSDVTKLIIRRADVEDLQEVSKVLALSWKSEMSGIVHDDYLETIREDRWIEPLSSGLNDGQMYISVLESAEGIQGVAVLRTADEVGTANLVGFYLLPERTGQGYGGFFFDFLEMEMLDSGYKKCVLDVLDGNARAIRFYEKKGFSYTGKTEKVPLGDHEYFCKIYEKELI